MSEGRLLGGCGSLIGGCFGPACQLLQAPCQSAACQTCQPLGGDAQPQRPKHAPTHPHAHPPWHRRSPECLHEKRVAQEEVVESIEIRDDKVGAWVGGCLAACGGSLGDRSRGFAASIAARGRPDLCPGQRRLLSWLPPDAGSPRHMTDAPPPAWSRPAAPDQAAARGGPLRQGQVFAHDLQGGV